jgi:hypothetical protein
MGKGEMTKPRKDTRPMEAKGTKKPGMSGMHTGKGHVMSHGTYKKGTSSK